MLFTIESHKLFSLVAGIADKDESHLQFGVAVNGT